MLNALSHTLVSRVPVLAAALATTSLTALVPLSHAQIATGPSTIELKTIATGLIAPVSLKSPPDNTNRLFVVEQTGQIRIIQNGVLLPTPFLNIAAAPSLMPALAAGYDERGLLDIAFHPNYATNGRFFIRYSRPRTGVAGVDPCFGSTRGCHTEVLAEYTVSAGNPNIANPASGVVLFTVDKPQFNHNGGGINFGPAPENYLYMTMGDGGGANDGLADTPPSHGPTGNAQNIAVPLGKLLRFDVSVPGTVTYPPTNPFVSTAGAHGGIYAYGLRNPYGFGFDDFGPAHTGALIMPDVGQDLFEELNPPIIAGGNYGWPIREGTHCFNPLAPTVPPASCTTAGLIDPVADYAHASGGPIGIAVIAGFIYRGPSLPGLTGQYIFGDFATAFGSPNGHLFIHDSLSPTANPILRPSIGAPSPGRNLSKYLKGMGRDAQGEIYILTTTTLGPTGTTGEVVKIIPCPADINGSTTITVQDIFDFIALWFALDARADINGIGGVTVQDIFDYLARWFAGC